LWAFQRVSAIINALRFGISKKKTWHRIGTQLVSTFNQSFLGVLEVYARVLGVVTKWVIKLEFKETTCILFTFIFIFTLNIVF